MRKAASGCLFAVATLACAVLFGSLVARAAGTSSLTGLIYTLGADQVQVVWPNARVTLKNQKSGASVSTVSGTLGEFSFIGLDPGEYELTVALAGFEAEVRRVQLKAKTALRVEIELHPKARQEKIVVRGETSGVDVTSTSIAAPALPQKTLQSLPLINEQFQDALPLLPGVIRGPDGLIDIKGARASESGTLVNSISVVDPVTGQSAISLPLEAVQSVKVLPNPFSAEYGRFSGGITEVQTRSGTDQWKFLLTDFLPRIRVRAGSIMGLASVTPRLTFAGPLRKDKLFLFQSFQYRFVRTPVPSLPPLARDTQFETFDSYTRFDWNITPNQLFSGSLTLYPQNLRFVNLNTFNPQPTTPNFRQRGYFLLLNERAIFTSGGFLESFFSAKRYDAHVWPGQIDSGEFTLFPEQNSGNWYDKQDRESIIYNWSQTYHARPVRARGTHLIEFGYSFDRENYDGAVFNRPLRVLREDGTLSQQVSFAGLSRLSQGQNAVVGFVEDQWSPSTRLTLNLGMRVDHQGVSDDRANLAPRVAFVFSPTRNNKTAIRGGFGVFYGKMPLDLGTFLNYPAETVTQFAADGITIAQGPLLFVHRVGTTDGLLHVPYSLTWELQVDHELLRGLLFRFGFEQRETHRDFFVNPVAPPLAPSPELLLFNNGRQSYREFQWTIRWQATARTTVFGSYVHSHAAGELNDYEQFFGDYPNAILRPNQHQRLPFDAPDRVLLWGAIGLPWKLEFSPVLDVHSGFPFSEVDSNLNFVGARDAAGRFPTFASMDTQLVRPFTLRALGHELKIQAGLKVFNVTNHFNPRDVQNNITSPLFGSFFNSVGRQFRAKFEIEF